MLRQMETLEQVASYGPLEKHVRHRSDEEPSVTEYHTDEYFVRVVYESDQWLVKWYSSGAHPLGEVGRYDEHDEAIADAKETVTNILDGLDDPRPL